jgi:hypothetical protein
MRGLLAAALLLACQVAMALCPEPPTKACSAWFRADKVFVGKVTKKLDIDRVKDGGEIVYTLAVERSLKGKSQKVEEVRSGPASGRWEARIGERHVVFVHQGRVGEACSELDNPRYTDRTLRQLQAMRRAVDSRIEGEVSRERGGRSSVPGVEVRAVAEDGRAYMDVSDANGRFIMQVPPGRYALSSTSPLRASELARRDVDGFDVAAGECAQFSILVD